ncbi:hypothetical protein ABID39_000712 [Bartonella japonica]|uniref:Uncharacterized protein n=1 Tax=Bartonella japonica TaxID=357761 RepID=A0ABV2FN75_9HYPH
MLIASFWGTLATLIWIFSSPPPESIWELWWVPFM